ncbi:M85 family metallopeptidase [Photobacterium damselae subsp. piscicida]|nr:M85 family metallopeptidase [Photobacterium damselae subsp. piscicida]
MVHHVTGSSDTHEENKQGPTEILAQMVAAELHWTIPTFKGYSNPARVEAIQERDFHSLLEMFQRHGSELGFLFTRLATIAKGKKASPDSAP